MTDPVHSRVSARPIRGLRWWIGGILFASTVINYIDRQTLSALAPFLKRDYHWTNEDYALIVISFRVAYAIGQTALGRMMDRLGTRLGLTITVAWYSVVAMLHLPRGWAAEFCLLPVPARHGRVGQLARGHQGGGRVVSPQGARMGGGAL